MGGFRYCSCPLRDSRPHPSSFWRGDARDADKKWGKTQETGGTRVSHQPLTPAAAGAKHLWTCWGVFSQLPPFGKRCNGQFCLEKSTEFGPSETTEREVLQQLYPARARGFGNVSLVLPNTPAGIKRALRHRQVFPLLSEGSAKQNRFCLVLEPPLCPQFSIMSFTFPLAPTRRFAKGNQATQTVAARDSS